MKRTRLKPVSNKRASRLKIYYPLAKEYKKLHPTCEVCKKRPTVDVHHKKGRYGSLLNMVEFWLPVCRACHDWIHRDPCESKKQGYKL